MKLFLPISRIREKWLGAAPGNKIAAAATLVIAAITITPFCGFLFACGCTWPGLGLESFCNIHNPLLRHRCPWCASQWAGILSVALATGLGTAASVMAFQSRPKDWNAFAVTGRILLGASVFLLTAFLFGLMSASSQNYPFAPPLSLY
jgi:hypothetical protein